MTKDQMTILSVGATGTIGRHVVEEALKMGHRVRALVRNASADLPKQAELVVADITNPETLAGAVDGVDAVIFTHGTYGSVATGITVDYGVVRNVLLALGDRPANIALMTTLGATDRMGAHDSKRRAERLVRASGRRYTIVRPGWFDHNGADELELVVRQGDRIHTASPADGVVSRRQVALTLIKSLTTESAASKTIELVAKAGPETTDYGRLFASAEADPAGTLDGIFDEANMPFDTEPENYVIDLDRVRSLRPQSGSK